MPNIDPNPPTAEESRAKEERRRAWVQEEIERSIRQRRFKAAGVSRLTDEERAAVEVIVPVYLDDLTKGDGRRAGGRLPKDYVKQLLEGFGRPPKVLMTFSSLRRDGGVEALDEANRCWQNDVTGWKILYYEPLAWVRQQVAQAARLHRNTRGPVDMRVPLIGRSTRTGPYTIDLWVEVFEEPTEPQLKRRGLRRRELAFPAHYLTTSELRWMSLNVPEVYAKLVSGGIKKEMGEIDEEAQEMEKAAREKARNDALALRKEWLKAHPAALPPEPLQVPVVPTAPTAPAPIVYEGEDAEIIAQMFAPGEEITAEKLARARMIFRLNRKRSSNFTKLQRERG